MNSREEVRRERVDGWLASGGVVVAANERAARALRAAVDGARQASGLRAWATTAIYSWDGWLHELWGERNLRGLVLLNSVQERSVWKRVIVESRTGAELLHPGRLAEAAQRALRLLCDYAPATVGLDSEAMAERQRWADNGGDAAVYSGWLAEFEGRCRREGLLSGCGLALELAASLRGEAIQKSNGLPGKPSRPPLLLIGFDRLLAMQEALLEAWGAWKLDESGEAAAVTPFWASRDSEAETAACVRWLRARLEANADARLMVVATGLQARRGELERALFEAGLESGRDFEFSLGVPLARAGVVRAALLLLQWQIRPLSEPELDWLVTSGHCTASEEEEIALAGAMLRLRHDGQERPDWPLSDFCAALGWGSDVDVLNLPFAWAERMMKAHEELNQEPRKQSPLDWVDVSGRILSVAGWPGFRPVLSVGFQALDRWEKVLEECASLGLDGMAMEWAEFVEALTEALADTIFATESTEAAIQITEPLAAAGQLADGIWFLGGQEQDWPGSGQPHPLLPLSLQRERGMPHSSYGVDWELARQATERLLRSADEVIFSYARQTGEIESRPSRLIAQLAGAPMELPPTAAGVGREILTEAFEDRSMVPFPLEVLRGGAAALTRQSQCPFQAFATTRLAAEDWDPAEVGLNAKQRGSLLHDVLHRVWGGSRTGGLASLEELRAIPMDGLRGFVLPLATAVMKEWLQPVRPGERRRASMPRRFPERYLALEVERLTDLVSEWLAYESLRQTFTVEETEATKEVVVAGLRMQVRMDRVDLLPTGGRLVIDYKSSEVNVQAWAGERPDNVQLPLYATHAFTEVVEGLAFAQVRPGKMVFKGRLRDAGGTLLAGLSTSSGLVKEPLTEEQLAEWRALIEELGEDFKAGRAEVDPKPPGKVCEKCRLKAVCRIAENKGLAELTDDEESGAEGEFGGRDDA